MLGPLKQTVSVGGTDKQQVFGEAAFYAFPALSADKYRMLCWKNISTLLAYDIIPWVYKKALQITPDEDTKAECRNVGS